MEKIPVLCKSCRTTYVVDERSKHLSWNISLNCDPNIFDKNGNAITFDASRRVHIMKVYGSNCKILSGKITACPNCIG